MRHPSTIVLRLTSGFPIPIIPIACFYFRAHLIMCDGIYFA